MIVALRDAGVTLADIMASETATDAVRVTRQEISERMQLFEIVGKKFATDCEAAVERLRNHPSVLWVERDARREKHL